MKLAPAEKQSVVSLSGFMELSKKPTSWSMIILFLRKIRGELGKKYKSESAKSDPEDIGNTYGIDHLKIGEANHNLDGSK